MDGSDAAMTAEPHRSAPRLLLAVGDAERERALARELTRLDVVIAARSLDAPSLLEHGPAQVDVALVAADLHRLTPALLASIQERGVPVVLLASEAADVERYGAVARVVPSMSSAAALSAAVVEAAARGPVNGEHPAAGGAGEDLPARASADVAPKGEVMAVTSGKGAPGKTTMAIALAASLARGGAEVVLVDADLRGGNIAPYLDLDPRRGLVGLAPDGTGHGGQGVLEELQQGPGFAVLAGVERPELAGRLSGGVLGEAVALLRRRFEHVIVDAGSYGESREQGEHEAVLRGCDRLLLVTGADLVSIWNAQVALRAVRARLGRVGDAAAVVVNRREGREHYDGEEVERALEAPVLGVVREDRKAARRAVDAQSPMSVVGGGAARDLHALGRSVSEGDGLGNAAGRTRLGVPVGGGAAAGGGAAR